MATTPSATLGHRNRPRSRRLVNRQAPWPSCQITFNRSPHPAPRKQRQMAAQRIALQHLLHQKRQAGEALPHHRYGPWQATPAPRSATGSSGSSTRQRSHRRRQRRGIDRARDPKLYPAGKCDLDRPASSGTSRPCAKRLRRNRDSRKLHLALLPPGASRLPMNQFGPAAAKPSANWDAHHAGVPLR